MAGTLFSVLVSPKLQGLLFDLGSSTHDFMIPAKNYIRRCHNINVIHDADPGCSIVQTLR